MAALQPHFSATTMLRFHCGATAGRYGHKCQNGVSSCSEQLLSRLRSNTLALDEFEAPLRPVSLRTSANLGILLPPEPESTLSTTDAPAKIPPSWLPSAQSVAVTTRLVGLDLALDDLEANAASLEQNATVISAEALSRGAPDLAEKASVYTEAICFAARHCSQGPESQFCVALLLAGCNVLAKELVTRFAQSPPNLDGSPPRCLHSCTRHGGQSPQSSGRWLRPWGKDVLLSGWSIFRHWLTHDGAPACLEQRIGDSASFVEYPATDGRPCMRRDRSEMFTRYQLQAKTGDYTFHSTQLLFCDYKHCIDNIGFLQCRRKGTELFRSPVSWDPFYYYQLNVHDGLIGAICSDYGITLSDEVLASLILLRVWDDYLDVQHDTPNGERYNFFRLTARSSAESLATVESFIRSFLLWAAQSNGPAARFTLCTALWYICNRRHEFAGYCSCPQPRPPSVVAPVAPTRLLELLKKGDFTEPPSRGPLMPKLAPPVQVDVGASSLQDLWDKSWDDDILLRETVVSVWVSSNCWVRCPPSACSIYDDRAAY
ncbi:hypothetical protein N7532_002564 [Penicillium argentinense]|uniref:Uncharacterized protein n=1 Tax=Penicillium argentinense TaxID=1131581 RepID=A0A9W9KKD5_9EURO|nr:uncharacterized protein N7532_002564 [Penicillium argentinense]KAJ5109919.1 hypothetical protein N7532_002564 [Penicillium argentinense]